MSTPPDEDAVAAAIAGSDLLARRREAESQGRLLVGFSGGMDSTVLLHALGSAPRVEAVHVNHGVASAAGDWVRHCRRVAGGLGVRLRVVEVAVEGSGNLEANLRRARYDAFAALLDPGDTLAIAHHADDQAETRVWQLLTGRHPGGMPAERELGAGRLVRPLLGLRRQALKAYARRHDLGWVEDPMNADPDLDRAFIRHRLMPVVEERFPDAVRLLAAPRHAAGGLPRGLPADAGPDAVTAWLEAAGMPLARRTIAEIHRQGAAAPDRNPVVRVTPSVCAWRHAGVWRLVRDAATGVPSSATARAGVELALPGGVLRWRRERSGLAEGRVFRVAARARGETIRTPAGSRRLKALFQENRVPPWERPAWPLLFDETGLVAVPNLALAAGEEVGGGWLPVWRPAERELGEAPAP